jgi:transposase
MRFYTKQHKAYCGIDLHARSMYVCILRQDGELLLHRNLPPRPERFLKALAPSRAALVVAGACLLTWYGLADRCAREEMPFVLGPALSMKAIHGGTANNDPLDAQNIAVRLRGGMLPQAYGYPAARRASRALLRRRRHLVRRRAELLTHVPQTNRQAHGPEIGTDIADKTHRPGGAERFAAPAVPKSVAVDLARIDYDDQWLRDLEWAMVPTAKQHDANTLSLLQSVPGLGPIRRLVLWYESQDLARCPRGQAFVSYCRLSECAKESAGKRYGPAGTQSGNASLTWAVSTAAVLLLRHTPGGPKYLARLAKQPGKGQALTILAHQLARAIYALVTRRIAFALDALLPE